MTHPRATPTDAPEPRARRSPAALVLRRPTSLVAMFVLLVFVGGAILAPVIAPFDPRVQPNADVGKNKPPSAEHLFGTDHVSRDVFSRVLYGARISLGVGVASVLVAVTLGVLVGAMAGFAGGWFDIVAMRFVDAVLSVPRLLLLIVLRASIGSPGIVDVILLLGLTGWPAMSRIVRAEARALRARDFVLAARATGARESRVLLHHVVPGLLPPVIVAATLALATVIPLEAGLAFLGLGVAPPSASWGSIILDADRPADTWWLVLFPGLAIVAIVLAVNTIGDRLREALDPREHSLP